MTATVLTVTVDNVPAVLAAAGDRARTRASEFFAAHISNDNTRQAYGRAVSDFCAWLERRGLISIADLQTLHVAAYIRELADALSAPTVKQRLAAIRAFLDWLVTGGILPFNPAAAVRGPKHSVKRGKTTVLSGEEARRILDGIEDTTPAGLPDLAGLRDRALIALMVYSFARIGAAVGMRVEDVYQQQNRLWVRLHEKGGKRHDMPCHHNLETYLREYLTRAGLADPKAFLFPTVLRGTGALGTTPLPRENAYAMVQRRAKAAGIAAKIGNHTFRATGVTAYLKNGGTLERAAAMANHASTRTTQLYDRRHDDMSLDDVERISI